MDSRRGSFAYPPPDTEVAVLTEKRTIWEQREGHVLRSPETNRKSKTIEGETNVCFYFDGGWKNVHSRTGGLADFAPDGICLRVRSLFFSGVTTLTTP